MGKRASAWVMTLVLLVSAVARAQVDLQARYPAARAPIDDPQQLPAWRTPLPWDTGPEHVYQLSKFALDLGEELAITIGEADLVLGVSPFVPDPAEGADPDAPRSATPGVFTVAWALVIPREPGRIAARTGNADDVTSVWLRFTPDRLNELFPPDTVLGPGEGWKVALARRVADLKVRQSWHARGTPVVPTKGSMIVDAETNLYEPLRRFYQIAGQVAGQVAGQTSGTKVAYREEFEERGLQPPLPLNDAESVEIFDRVWKEFDTTYAMFGLREGVDWDRARETYRPIAAGRKNNLELAAVLATMIGQLRDLHATVVVNNEAVRSFVRPVRRNFTGMPSGSLLRRVQRQWKTLSTGRTEDEIGYVNLRSLDATAADDFDEALEGLAHCWALVIDLRSNGGGDERLAQQIVGRFLTKPVVYSRSRVRSGPGRTDLTEPADRVASPREANPWRWEAPVVVLQGGATFSSAESMVLMFREAGFETIGDTTAGSSGNPKSLELPHGLVVNVPRWLDLDPQNLPVEGRGVKPTVEMLFPVSEFDDGADPLLAKVVERLRQTHAEGARSSGRPGATKPTDDDAPPEPRAPRRPRGNEPDVH
ncbi:MAG: S41 family peptidase [Planctomycetota bacterium]|nr:S41 family peptidase [Planctomycetota bacterium]